MENSKRLAALRARMTAEDIEALALTHVPNVLWASGFDSVFDEEPAHVLLLTSSSATLFTDSRYAEAAILAADGTACSVCVATSDLFRSVCSAVSESEASRVAVETTLPYGRFRSFEKQVGVPVVPVTGWVETLRQVKEAEEIERIRHAQELTDAAFEHILGIVRPGVSEREIAIEIECFMRRNGSDGVAFPAIVASGPNSAFPHAAVTDRCVETGDAVVVDFGARVRGYCADMTRTFVVGRAPERLREIYEVVRAANLAGVRALRPDAIGSDVDAVGRGVIADAGLGEYFGHGLGHGVGVEVHELPGVGPRSDKPIPDSSVVTVEPGVYVPGFGGVRIEDLAVVDASGATVLTRSTKDLLEIF